MPDTLTCVLRDLGPAFQPPRALRAPRPGEPVLGPSTCGTGCARASGTEAPSRPSSLAHSLLSPARLRLQRGQQVATGRCPQSARPRPCVPIGDSPRSPRQPRTLGRGTCPLGKVRATLPSRRDGRTRGNGGSGPASHPWRPRQEFPSGKMPWFLSLVSTAGSLQEQERGQIPSSCPPALTCWCHLSSWPQTHVTGHPLMVSPWTGTWKPVERAGVLPEPSLDSSASHRAHAQPWVRIAVRSVLRGLQNHPASYRRRLGEAASSCRVTERVRVDLS